MIRTLKPKCCRACRNPYQPWSSTQQACSPLCAQAVASAKRHKAEQAETKKKLLAIKPRKQWMKEAQAVFNTFIRERDYGLSCICCGQYPKSTEALRGGVWDAGHFRSVGACPELRFDEDNVSAQLKGCNRKDWDVQSYRANLIGRIGLERVKSLEGPHPPCKHDIPALKLLIATYRAKTRALKAQRESMLEAA